MNTFKTTFRDSRGRSRVWGAGLTLCGLLAAGPTGLANTYVWSGTSGSWTNQANWTGATLPTTTNDVAAFTNVNLSADAAITLDGNQTANTLVFSNLNATPAANWIINPGGQPFNTLTLGGATPPFITVAPLGSGKSVILNAELSVSGSVNLTKNGAGTLTLQGYQNLATTFTNAAGTIAFNTGIASGTGTMILAGGAIDNTSGGLVNIGNAVTVNADTTVVGTAPIQSGATWTLGASHTLSVNGAMLALNGTVAGPGYTLTKAGAGVLLLQGNNTFSTLVVTNGLVAFKSDNLTNGVNTALGTTPSSFTAGNLVINGGSLVYAPNTGNSGFNTNRGILLGPSSGTGGGTLDVLPSFILTNDCVMANNGSGTGSLTVAGSGTMKVGGANSFTGGVNIGGGGTVMLDFTQVGAPVTNIFNVANGLTLSAGRLYLNGNASAVNGQSFSGVTVTNGQNALTNLAGASGSVSFNLGGIGRTGGQVDFAGAGVYTVASTNNNAAGILGGWATLNNNSDWAAVNGTTLAAPAYTPLATTGGAIAANYTNNGNTTLTGSVIANSVKLTGGTISLGGNNLTVNGTNGSGGLLATNTVVITGSGYVGAGSGKELLVSVAPGKFLITTNAFIGNADPGSLTFGSAGTGTLQMAGTNTYTGLTTVNGGTLTLLTGGSLASPVKVNTGGLLAMNTGSAISGNVEVGPSTGYSGNNFSMTNATITGTLTLDSAELPASVNANNIAQSAPGNGLLKSGTTITGGVVDNGILTVDVPVAAGGISVGTISSPNGRGALVYNSTNANTLTLGSGSQFSYLQFGSASQPTLQVQGGGTVGVDWFSISGAGPVPNNETVTLANGTWNVGWIGQNNSYAAFAGTVDLTGGAAMNIFENNGYDHGTWNVQNGSLNFYGAVAEAGSANVATNSLNLSVNNSGGGAGSTLTVLGGGLTLGLAVGNIMAESNTLNVATGGTAIIGGGITLGSTTNQPFAETNAINLTGGKLLVNGTITAGSSSGQTALFNWTGGQLSALTITPAALFSGGGALSSSGFTQNGGTLAPGDVGFSGKTTLSSGSYTLSSGTLGIDLGGTNASASFQDAPTAGKFDNIAVSSGSATLGGSLSVNLIGGFTPANANTFAILTATSVSGTFNNVYNNRVTVAGTGGASLTVTVNAANVTLGGYTALTPGWTVQNPSAPAGTTVAFTNNASVGAITNWIVDFGDGSTRYTNSVSAGGTLPAGAGTSHIYSAGSYTAKLVVVASDGSSATNSQAISATSNPTLAWTGSASANWNATDLDWTNLTSGGLTTAYQDGDPVIFNDVGAAHPVVTLAGAVLPAALTFSNNSTTYTLKGAGKVSGATTVTLTQSGTVVLLTTNDYSGGTTVNGGVLQLGDGATANGAPGAGAVTNNATVVVDPAGPQTLTNAISGSGAVEVVNSTVTLTGANNYNGGTTVSNGAAVAISADNNLGASGTGLTLNNGSLQVTTSSALTLSHPMVVNSGGATLNLADTLTTTQNNTGSGTLTVSAGTLQVGNNGTAGAVAGNLALNGGSLTYGRTDTIVPAGTISANSAASSVTNLDTATGNTNTLTFANGVNTFGTIRNTSGALVLTGTANTTNLVEGNVVNSGGVLQFAGGNWQVTNNFIPGGGSLIFAGAAVTASGGMFNYTATNLVVNAGNLLVGGGQRLSPVTAGATLTVSGGSLTVSNTTYGARLGNSSANNASQAGFLSFAGVQTGGTVLIVSNGDNVLSLGGFGPATSGQSASYTLSGGSLIIPSGGGSGNGLWLGADSNQLATTTFTLAGTGTVLAYNIKGAQGGGAQQVLNFSGGTLSAAAINMSLLQSSNAPTVSGTLYNNGGVLAPGGLGLPGKTTITGNYTNAANTALVVDLGGTNAASLFQDTSSNSYDNVSVTGGTLVNGALTVNLLNGFSPALTNGFTILASAGGVSGSFTNLFAGNRVAVAGNPAYSFQVLTTSTAVILTNFELNAPLVTVSPATDAVPYGSNVVLSAVATGVAPLAYQWYDENTNLISGATGATLTLTSPAVAASGNYTVVVTNIYGVATNLAAVTVSPATLTITANSAIKTYGQTVSYGAGSSAFTSTGLQNGQTVGSVTITAGGGTAATAPVGVYSLTPGAATGGTFNPANYSIAYNPNTLTVNALGVTATANPQTKVYGTADPALTYGFSPALVGGDTFSGGLSRAAGSAVGSYAITQGTLALSTNYSLTYVGTNLTITPAALTITANNASKTYGNTLTFAGTEFTASTLVTGDSVSSVTLNSAGATNTAAPGSYSIVPSAATGTGLGNYSIAYTNGTLTVSAANAGLTVGSSQTPVGYLGGVAFTATVNTNATGSVVFTDVAGAFSTNTLTAGTAASVTITNLPRGTNVITVVYSGDPDYAAATNTFEEVVTNHPPVAQTMTVTFTAGLGGEIALTDLATNWSDGDGDAVELTAINFTSTNGATVWPINLTTNLGGSYALTASAYLGYSNPANVPDRITYTISDGFGGSATGSINILIQTAVTGTNSITSLVSGIPTSLTAYGVPGFSYITQRSTNLTDWVEISTNTAATNGVINVNDGFSDLGGIAPTQAYYRLRWRP